MSLLVRHSHRWWHYPGKRILPDGEVRASATYISRKIALLQVQFTHLSLKFHVELDALDGFWGDGVLQMYLRLWLIDWWAIALGIIASLRAYNTTSSSWKVFWPTSLQVPTFIGRNNKRALGCADLWEQHSVLASPFVLLHRKGQRSHVFLSFLVVSDYFTKFVFKFVFKFLFVFSDWSCARIRGPCRASFVWRHNLSAAPTSEWREL